MVHFLSIGWGPSPGSLMTHQGLGRRHAGERTRTTFMAHLGRLRRAADRLLPVAGRRSPGRTDPSDRGRDGGRLPDADGPASPAPRRGPKALWLRALGTSSGTLAASREPRPEAGA